MPFCTACQTWPTGSNGCTPTLECKQRTERDSDKTWAASGDIATDLDRCLTELRRCGCPDVYVVDLTTREQRLLGLVTVRVLVPGLAPIDFGHPRHRVARLPRMQLDDELQALRTNGDRPNPLPHPFP